MKALITRIGWMKDGQPFGFCFDFGGLDFGNDANLTGPSTMGGWTFAELESISNGTKF